jgi:CRISPR/Cas system-associated exonuclease Cas4 (RecB family)
MKYAPYSFSRLNTHNSCNRKFKYSYIDKVQPENTDKTALLKGGALHSIIEHFPDNSPHKLAPKYQHIFNKFIISDLGKWYLFRDSIREYDFGLDYNLNPCSYNNKQALFRGSVDFICTIDNILHLCDWKSGNLKDEKYQSYDQLMFYAVYFFQKYEKIKTIKISYVYIEHENQENTMTLERKYLNVYTKQLTEMIESAENDTIHKKNITRLCDYCEFKKHCSEDINN